MAADTLALRLKLRGKFFNVPPEKKWDPPEKSAAQPFSANGLSRRRVVCAPYLMKRSKT